MPVGLGLVIDSGLRSPSVSARMGLEVRGAMMNPPQQKDIPNV
jgi:hypothetical protein